MTELMKQYTIYQHLEAPEPRYFVHEVLIGPGSVTVGEVLAVDVSLQEARDVVPWQNDTCILRAPDDALEIVETWI